MPSVLRPKGICVAIVLGRKERRFRLMAASAKSLFYRGSKAGATDAQAKGGITPRGMLIARGALDPPHWLGYYKRDDRNLRRWRKQDGTIKHGFPSPGRLINTPGSQLPICLDLTLARVFVAPQPLGPARLPRVLEASACREGFWKIRSRNSPRWPLPNCLNARGERFFVHVAHRGGGSRVTAVSDSES